MKQIEIKNLSYEYKSFDENENRIYTKAINSINLDIEKGEFVVILGHNGSGKSTLAKLLNAQIFPTKGDIYINSMNTKDEDKLWQIRKSCSMVFQNPDNQIVATTVEEDVAFGPENLQIQNPKLRERVDNAIELVEMSGFKKKAPSELSGGQKQRVAIAGVVAMLSDLIVFDEPTAMLDPSGRKQIVKLVKKLNKELGKTIIYITHYMEEAVDADRIIVMNDGQIAMQGTPREVFGKVKEMKELSLSVPQVTELAYELQKEGIEIKKVPLTIQELMEEI
ncbi:MAG: energy-coupling factor transporter ATPase [Peptoniphilaceae bacterium]|nr:energy-coupling factor transporter ATPase [Peptoniphilaceae bacterium]MDD7383918.1 energy-coupling factor transporter ATPase [Peptoniphilaceae bacterium]MDY3738061.1 energy-coupling factor transporter ATPase [Peptoniphilaceae bacterium]